MARERRPMRKVGERSKRRAPLLGAEQNAVRRRASHRCEWCGVPDSERGMEIDHVFGREGTGLKLGKWAHHHTLLRRLCCNDPRYTDLGCHEKRQRYLDKEMCTVLAEQCAMGFAQEVYIPLRMPLIDAVETLTPEEWMLAMVRALDEYERVNGPVWGEAA